MGSSHLVQIPILSLARLFLSLWHPLVVVVAVGLSGPVRSIYSVHRLSMVIQVGMPVSRLVVQRLVVAWFFMIDVPCSDENLHKDPNDNNHGPHEYDYAAPTRWWLWIRVNSDDLEIGEEGRLENLLCDSKPPLLTHFSVLRSCIKKSTDRMIIVAPTMVVVQIVTIFVQQRVSTAKITAPPQIATTISRSPNS